jgi:hypothetical protein
MSVTSQVRSTVGVMPAAGAVAGGRSAPRAGRLAIAVGLGSCLLYAATLAGGVGWDDAGELSAAVARLGIVHRPAYPLYVLLGHVFATIFPFGSTALRVNLWTALTAGAAVAATAYLVCWRARSALAGVVAAGLLATGGLFWSQAIEASAYPMFVLSIVLLLIAANRWYDRRTPARLAWLAAAAGAVTVSNSSGWFFIPAAIALVASATPRRRPRSADVAALAAFALPWLSALYVPLRAHAAVFPNAVTATGEHWWHALYGLTTAGDGPFLAAPGEVFRHAVKLGMLGLVELSVAALVLVPVGLWALRRDRVFVVCGLAPSVLVGALALTTTYSYPFLYLPLIAVGAITSGAAVPVIGGAISRLGPLPRTAAAATTAAVVATGAIAGARYIGRHDPDASRWAAAVLAAVPKGATIEAPWPAFAALSAEQEVAPERRDVRLVYAPFLTPTAAALATPGFVVALQPAGSPRLAGARLAPLGPRAAVQRKGMTGIAVGSFQLGDPPYEAQAYDVLGPKRPG